MESPERPARSHLRQFVTLRTSALSAGRVHRKRLTNAYNHLAFATFNQSRPGGDSLLAVEKTAPPDNWTCATCNQGIWSRVRRVSCPLCSRFHHTACLRGTLIVVKPLPRADAGERRPAKRVRVCVECEKDVAALRKFAAFLPSLRVQRKITVFYDLFHKLQVNIAECIGAFGLFVKSFVENDLVAKRALYIECQKTHRNLMTLFDSLTKALKRLVDATFELRGDTLVAKSMRAAISEWTQERLSQMRALEMQWKLVKPEELPAAPARAQSASVVSHQRTASLPVVPAADVSASVVRAAAPAAKSLDKPVPKMPPPPKVSVPPTPPVSSSALPKVRAPFSVDSMSPLVCPLHGATQITISGSNFDSAVGVRIAGVPCVVHEVMGNTLIVEAPALDDDGFKDVELYDLDDERPVVRLPGMLMYSAQDFRDPAEIALEAALASSDEDENYDEWDSFLETLPSVTITSLNPVVSPLNGTTVELQGNGFDAKVSVFVDGVECSHVSVAKPAFPGGPQLVTFRSPALLEDGVKPVAVVNPNGTRARLDSVLYYGDIE